MFEEKKYKDLQKQEIFYNKMSSYYYPEYFSNSAISRFSRRYKDALENVGYSNLPGVV